MCNLYSSPESTYIYDVHEIYSQLAVLLSPLLSSPPATLAGWQTIISKPPIQVA